MTSTGSVDPTLPRRFVRSPARRLALVAVAALAAAVGCARARPAASVVPPAAGTAAATSTPAAAAAAPARVYALRVYALRVYALRADALADARARLRAGDASLRPAYEKLLGDADKALPARPVAVTDKKTLLPPSGDPHDYFSLSPYWWPDPSKPDGLPYVRRDGETNPESKRDLDQPRVAAMGARAHTLALAYYFSGDEKYARVAAEQLRVWFLNAETRMNPHLRFAQLVRGIDRERGSGIIDTRWFIEAVDAAGLLEGSAAWGDGDRRAMRDWFAAYLRWLRASPNGQQERAARNNHGSWYAAQTMSYALFTGDTSLAREIASVIPERIGWQIGADGAQPIEMERTRSLHYSGFNIEALSRVAEMARHVGVDVWGYRSPRGGSLRAAIDHVAPYVADPARWPGRQIDPIELELFVIHLRRAQTLWPDGPYRTFLRALPSDLVTSDRSALLYPNPR